MQPSLTCFWVEPTDREHRSLRRYAPSDEKKCPGTMGYHNASVPWMEDAPAIRTPEGYHSFLPESEWPERTDPRWPTRCEHCDYEFVPEDKWQIFSTIWYVRPDTGERFQQRALPPGAMYDSWWYPDSWKGPDKKALTVMLPNRIDWCIDAPSTGGGRWTRSGEIPHITASPSILVEAKPEFGRKRYHGFLTDGILCPTSDSEC